MGKTNFPIVLLFLVFLQFITAQDWLKVSKQELLNLRNSINAFEGKKSDIVFLVDTSGSLYRSDFNEEKKFVMNLLNEMSVGMQANRVEVIPFGTSASKFITQISDPKPTKNKCTFNEIFNPMQHSINGWMTNMKDAFEFAWQVWLNNGNKRTPLTQIKTVVILLTDGYWNYPISHPSPVQRAQELVSGTVEIFAIGVGNGVNQANLRRLVDQRSIDQHAFFLKDFNEFAELATYIRGDPYEYLWQTENVHTSKCNGNCDPKAYCSCGLVYGDYKCSCPAGHSGSGFVGQCKECPPSTYKTFLGYAPSCNACPANSGHQKTGSTTIADCKCFDGYEGTPENGNDCIIRSCDALSIPENGALQGSCYRTYGSSCTFACNEGYELSGTPTRTCTVNAANQISYSGSSWSCTVIRCPAQKVDYAKPPSGTCVDKDGIEVADLKYGTRCFFTCGIGYNREGNEFNTCQLDKSWSPTAPICKQVTCPALGNLTVGRYIPPECDIGTLPYPTSCELRCPPGYHVNYLPTSILSDSRSCLLNGTWTYRAITPTCLDFQPPSFGNSCPLVLDFDNDPGKSVATVTWNVSWTDNSLIEDESGITVDMFKVNLTINDNDVDTTLPKLIGIGANRVKYVVQDRELNSGSCSFTVTVAGK
ncbi:sushi, von Willebrand factor type A, EGF and pentraxin domain-containing protein 1-like [Stylophora pistillata]|uniref:sushi, von Willebrand factor type A, EGF and pentraxin domain-containing protein 1-like n=1 Tax=Stylophora pistillata TaxID=50429 RepID=UPI000C03E0CB|nr:sushi, von Willebrand factor type A, EGF and pentraxin domain-containing protein 1-like [Stylophora pistillata]